MEIALQNSYLLKLFRDLFDFYLFFGLKCSFLNYFKHFQNQYPRYYTRDPNLFKWNSTKDVKAHQSMSTYFQALLLASFLSNLLLLSNPHLIYLIKFLFSISIFSTNLNLNLKKDILQESLHEEYNRVTTHQFLGSNVFYLIIIQVP